MITNNLMATQPLGLRIILLLAITAQVASAQIHSVRRYGEPLSSRSNTFALSDTTVEDEPGFWNDFYVYTSVGAQAFNWKPTERDGGGYISFKTKGLRSYNGLAVLGYRGMDALSLSYEGVFRKSREQEEMLVTNFARESGIERYTWGLKIDPFVQAIIPDDHWFSKYVLRRIFSIKFKYSHELYFGEAAGKQDFIFVPLDVGARFNSPLPPQSQRVSAGEKLFFQTLFVDYETSISAYTYQTVDVRIGYFQSKWERPSDYYVYTTVDDTLVILGYRFEASGVMLGIQTIDRGAPGFYIDLALRFAALSKRSITTSVEDLGTVFSSEDGSGLNYVSLFAGGWYNAYFDSQRNSGLYLSFGVTWERRRWLREYSTPEGQTSSADNFSVVENDEFLKFFGSLGFRL